MGGEGCGRHIEVSGIVILLTQVSKRVLNRVCDERWGIFGRGDNANKKSSLSLT